MISLFANVKNIIIAGLIALIVTLYIGAWQKDKTIAKLTQDCSTLKNECEINKKSYESALKKYNDTIEIADSQKEVEIRYINNYKGDPNESNCNNANSLLSNYKF